MFTLYFLEKRGSKRNQISYVQSHMLVALLIEKLYCLGLLLVITTLTLTLRASAKTLLWACCPVSRLGKVLAVGLRCSPSVLGKRCKVVKTTSLLRLLLHGSSLRLHVRAVPQPSLTSPRTDFTDEWPFPLLSIPFTRLALAKAESRSVPSSSSLSGRSPCVSCSSAPSLSSSFSCSSGPSRPQRSLWWIPLESWQEERQYLFKCFNCDTKNIDQKTDKNSKWLL